MRNNLRHRLTARITQHAIAVAYTRGPPNRNMLNLWSSCMKCWPWSNISKCS